MIWRAFLWILGFFGIAQRIIVCKQDLHDKDEVKFSMRKCPHCGRLTTDTLCTECTGMPRTKKIDRPKKDGDKDQKN